MIRENELRIGNWFHNSRGEVNQVKSIYDGYVNPYISMHTLDIDGDIFEDIEPILITAEIFEKCGFEYISSAWPYFTFNDIDIEVEGGGYAIKSSEWTIGKPFNYLHQLQNIYFALTGEELEVKL